MSGKNGSRILPGMRFDDPFLPICEVVRKTGRPPGTIGTWKKKKKIRSCEDTGHVSLNDVIERSKIATRHRQKFTRSRGGKTGTQAITIQTPGGSIITGITIDQIKDILRGGDSCL